MIVMIKVIILVFQDVRKLLELLPQVRLRKYLKINLGN
jgi:hypothetical protein